ncbi:MAG: 2-amino-4-hydroxy-6-hydroxymethyldihydropteridine diphosphokinase [Desulfonatronovibrionaceae bacterium]
MSCSRLEVLQSAEAAVGLGSNLGDSTQTISIALQEISRLSGVSLVRTSRLYKTEPQDFWKQPWFTNAAAKFRVDRDKWSALDFLRELLRIETEQGRRRIKEKGPRTLDLDLLLFGDEQFSGPEITLPHPRMHKRAFVLIPLLEISPELVLPGGKKLKEYLKDIDYSLEGNQIWQT